jgi:hypothetical protein
MKTFVLVLLFGVAASAEPSQFEYSNYRDLSQHLNTPGAYDVTYNCVGNDFRWDKKSQKYINVIEKYTENGTEIVQAEGDLIRVISSSTSSRGETYFSDTTTQYPSDNVVLGQGKSTIKFSDGNEIKDEFLRETKFENGEFVTVRHIVNGNDMGVTTDFKTSYVWNDESGLSGTEYSVWENSKQKQDMENKDMNQVYISSDRACTYSFTKK